MTVKKTQQRGVHRWNTAPFRALMASAIVAIFVGQAPAMAQTFFQDYFDTYTDDSDVTGAGWTISDTPQATEVNTTWTVTNIGGRDNPPYHDGGPTWGNFLISDSDAGDGDNPTGTGASHDAITPVINLSTATTPWLHVSVSAQANNGDTEAFIIDASTNGGTSFTTTLFERVSSARTSAPLPAAGAGNVGGYYGVLHLDLSALAGQANVKLRFRHHEPTDGWWFAIDNLIVNNTPGVSTRATVALNENFIWRGHRHEQRRPHRCRDVEQD